MWGGMLALVVERGVGDGGLLGRGDGEIRARGGGVPRRGHVASADSVDAAGGGAFIEPMTGEPRIVAGRVLVNRQDEPVLIRSAIPMLVELSDDADRSVHK